MTTALPHYANGTFKIINVPNADFTNVIGISANGLILGDTAIADIGYTFTAVCK
jgi:hypothetical protein